MKIEKCQKDSFVVIGKEGSSLDGVGFIQRLWKETNEHFDEIEQLAKKDEQGNLVGMWGAMSDFTHSFQPWENNFQNGLYLAGVECKQDVDAPEGWNKWTIPAYEYIYLECDNLDTFPEVIKYMGENNIPLAGAVHDFSDPQTGKNYMYFPVKRL